jgi:aerobic-type carbon monoxide dehydrogenase small subunit (CoxS/CutS family)
MEVAAQMLAGLHGAAIAANVHHVCICGTYPRIMEAILTL